MNITILTAGTRGDVTPYVAIALELIERGHTVAIYGHKTQGVTAEAYGVPFASCAPDDNQVLRTEAGQAILTKRIGTSFRNKLDNLREYARMVEHNYAQYLTNALQLTEHTDLVLANPFQSFFATVIADYYGCKLGYLGYIPGPPTSFFPHFLWPVRTLGPVTGIYNRFTHRITTEGVWHLGNRLLNRVLAKTLGNGVRLPRWYPESEYRKGNRVIGGPTHGELTLYGYSPCIIPQPPDWPPQHKVTGYWFLEPPKAWQPANELIEFLEGGTPPIYIGFGSMLYEKDDPIVHLISEVIKTSNERFIIGRGWSDIGSEVYSSSNAMVIDEVPFHWLFPKLKAAIHHGGAGTVAAALRAGIPSCVVTWITDQWFWGHRLWAIGAGIPPIKREHLDATRLKKIIKELTESRALHDVTRALSVKISNEDGIATAMHELYTAGLF